MCSALKASSVSAVLLAVVVGVAYVPRDGVDPEAIEAAALQPTPLCPPESMGFRIPAPDDYPLEYLPWIRSREDFVAHYTRGEDPDLVRRYSEGPEEELVAYLGEAFPRVMARYPMGLPKSLPSRPLEVRRRPPPSAPAAPRRAAPSPRRVHSALPFGDSKAPPSRVNITSLLQGRDQETGGRLRLSKNVVSARPRVSAASTQARRPCGYNILRKAQ